MRAVLFLSFAALSVCGPALAEGDYGLRDADPADPAFESAAFRHYADAFGAICYWGEDAASARAWAPDSWALEWPNDHGDQPYQATLYRFYCDSGAYNVRFVWYLDFEEEGPAPITFARPVFDVTYVDDDYDGDVQSITVRGYGADVTLINSEFDPETGTIHSAENWRGIGDASSRGQWVFRDGQFVLTRYEIDAAYDGEIAPQKTLTFD